MCFVSTYENRRMKPAEIVLRSRRGKRERWRGVNPAKRYFKHIVNITMHTPACGMQDQVP
jgi:hypothetical protein